MEFSDSLILSRGTLFASFIKDKEETEFKTKWDADKEHTRTAVRFFKWKKISSFIGWFEKKSKKFDIKMTFFFRYIIVRFFCLFLSSHTHSHPNCPDWVSPKCAKNCTLCLYINKLQPILKCAFWSTIDWTCISTQLRKIFIIVEFLGVFLPSFPIWLIFFSCTHHLTLPSSCHDLYSFWNWIRTASI